jgi:hypothetical protein
MTALNNIEHLVLKIKNTSLNLNFYHDFFTLLGYFQDQKIENYLNYSNGILPIGLYFEPTFQENISNSSGLGHIAWKTNDKELFEKLNKLIIQYDLKYETLGEIRKHHNQDFYTISFYCPSGNRLELISES